MGEQGQGVVVPAPTELLDKLDDDLGRIELWTAALRSFQHPAPACLPNSMKTEHRLVGQRDTGLPLGSMVRNTFEDQPYTVIAVALGLGWLLGRLHRSL